MQVLGENKMIPPLAQLYSPSLDKYFHSDNALFIFENGEWLEYLEPVFDLIQL